MSTLPCRHPTLPFALFDFFFLIFEIQFYLYAILCFVGQGLLWQGLLKVGLQVVFSKCNLIVVDVLERAKYLLIQELEIRFLAHGVMDAIGIVYL